MTHSHSSENSRFQSRYAPLAGTLGILQRARGTYLVAKTGSVAKIESGLIPRTKVAGMAAPPMVVRPPISRPRCCRPRPYPPSARRAASGSRSITRRSARAGPSGRRRPCSQLRRVQTETPNMRANARPTGRDDRRSADAKACRALSGTHRRSYKSRSAGSRGGP